MTGQAEQPDREVAQGGHDLGAGGGADAAGVFGEGDVADSVERFDLPVGAGQGTELLRAGVVSGLAAERVDEFCTTTTCWVCGKFRSGGTGAVWSDGAFLSAAALRYQRVMAGRDAAIAAALDALVEAAAALTETPPPAPSGTRVARIGHQAAARSDAEEQAFDLRCCGGGAEGI